jgi:hypothetical protein
MFRAKTVNKPILSTPFLRGGIRPVYICINAFDNVLQTVCVRVLPLPSGIPFPFGSIRAAPQPINVTSNPGRRVK